MTTKNLLIPPHSNQAAPRLPRPGVHGVLGPVGVVPGGAAPPAGAGAAGAGEGEVPVRVRAAQGKSR